MSSPYIDIHSHNRVQAPNFGISNLFVQDTPINTEFNFDFSMGLHPWHILKTDINEAIHSLSIMSRNSRMKAVGECGLDRSIAVNIEIQKEVFMAQMEIAEENNKLLIVHNVRAFADFFQILKERKPNIPLLFHAFNGNNDILKKLLKFNVFFSIGKDIFNERSKAYRVFNNIPINRLFFETDDADIRIEDVYSRASIKLGIEERSLRSQIYYNYKSLFL